MAVAYGRTMQDARILWDYMSSRQSSGQSDAIVTCCSYDLRVCDHACGLIKAGLAPLLILSGRSGNWTRHLWDESEAQVFRQRALGHGIPAEAIVTEDQATNFGENIGFVRRLRPSLSRITFVTKPNSVLRVLLTVPVQWPGISFFVSAPDLLFPEDVSNVVGALGLIEEMVGDIQRINSYPALGFQLAHHLPDSVAEAARRLWHLGFRNHPVPESPDRGGAASEVPRPDHSPAGIPPPK